MSNLRRRRGLRIQTVVYTGLQQGWVVRCLGGLHLRLAGQVGGILQDPQHFIRVVETHAVRRRDEVPHELSMAVQRACFIKQSWIGALPGRGSLQGGNGVDQGIFGGNLLRVDRILDGTEARQHHAHIRVTLSAGLLGVQEWAHDVVAGIFHRPVADVGHMAVRAGYSGLEVGAVGGI